MGQLRQRDGVGSLWQLLLVLTPAKTKPRFALWLWTGRFIRIDITNLQYLFGKSVSCNILISSLDLTLFVSMAKHTCSQYIFTTTAIFYTVISVAVRGLRRYNQNIFSFKAGLRLSWARAQGWRCRSNLVSDDFIKPSTERRMDTTCPSERERKLNVGRKVGWQLVGWRQFQHVRCGIKLKTVKIFRAEHSARCAAARRLSLREPILMQILMMLISFT